MGNNSCSRSKSDPPVACITRQQFIFSRVIGKGSFGQVWKVSDQKTRKSLALKVIDKARVITKRSVRSIMNQKEILSRLADDQSEFIVNMKGSFQDRENCYLLMDYLEGGDLRYYINQNYTFSEQQIRFLIRCLVQGLKYLHQRNIIHRDIKPQNIILDKEGYARITDLGIACYWNAYNSNETSGTPGYMAPEVLLKQNHSFSADLYAVGVIAYELVVGKRPYLGRNHKTVRDQILAKEAKVPSIYLTRFSKEAVDFINRLLQRVAKKRLGYNGMSQVLMHPWLAIKHQQRIQFLERRIPSPITPLQVVFSAGLRQENEPDKNCFPLKQLNVQKLFQGYDYMPNHHLSQGVKACSGLADSISTKSTIKTFKETR